VFLPYFCKMKIEEIKKEIKGVFKLPKKRYYFGKALFGTPYMFPSNYCGTVIDVRKKKPRFNRLNYFKLFGYYIFYGYPIQISNVQLGWKDKYNTPRYEWSPQFHIYMFGFQFTIFWDSPDDDNDRYYEMVLHYLFYADKDLKKARDMWTWIDGDTKKTTWNNNYLINIRKQKLKKLTKLYG